MINNTVNGYTHNMSALFLKSLLMGTILITNSVLVLSVHVRSHIFNSAVS